MNVGKKFRIYPTKEQQTTLAQWIGHQRFIYNSKVQEDRYFRKFKSKSLSLVGVDVPCDQQYSQFKSKETAFLKEVPSQILRNGAYKWMAAYQRFFKKLGGRPTIRKKHGRQSVMITKELFRFERIDAKTARIHLGTPKNPVGTIQVKTHLDYSIPNSIYISIHGGRWHVSFSNENGTPVATEAELLVALQHLTESQLLEVTAGFDRGVTIAVASSDGSCFDYSEEQKRSFEVAIKGKKKWQQRFSKRQKGSANRRKAAKRVAGYDRKIAEVRNDFAHKTSKKMVDAPGSLLVFEGLQIKNMTASAKGTIEKPGKNVRQKAGLNRSILHSSWGSIKIYTRYKGLKASKLTIFVPAAYSSQKCSCCGFTHKDNRVSQSRFICQVCGFECNADLNAAINIKSRGVQAVLNNEVAIKVPRKTVFRRAGTVRTDAKASTPVERVSAAPASKPLRSSRLNQETPTRTAVSFGGG
jgi:putative transposase